MSTISQCHAARRPSGQETESLAPDNIPFILKQPRASKCDCTSMSKFPYKLVVTDLDNTLYDWVTYFSHAFYAMVDAAVGELVVDREQLLDELRDVHRLHRNSEHPFALLETAMVRSRFPNATAAELKARLDVAFHAFNSARKERLRLYDSVVETLVTLRAQGVSIVGHTEATVPNALFRLDKLGIAPLFKKLYAVEPPDVPHPDPAYQAPSTPPVRYLGHNERKPDPAVLLDICREQAVEVGETLYVGDSLSRDVGMAKEAGVVAAWARYGTQFDKSAWDKLVRITHWTSEDVERAERAREKYAHVKPDLTLDSFGQLLE